MSKLPDLCPQFAILPKPSVKLTEEDLTKIEEMAHELGERRKSEGRGREEVSAIVAKLVQYDQERTGRVLERLGVEVLWIEDFPEIPPILEEIRQGA